MVAATGTLLVTGGSNRRVPLAPPESSSPRLDSSAAVEVGGTIVYGRNLGSGQFKNAVANLNEVSARGATGRSLPGMTSRKP